MNSGHGMRQADSETVPAKQGRLAILIVLHPFVWFMIIRISALAVGECNVRWQSPVSNLRYFAYEVAVL